MENKKRVFIGADPGKSGAICCIDQNSNVVSTHILPTIGKQYDTRAISKIIKFYSSSYDSVFAVENVGIIAKGTKATNASLHFCKGMLVGMVVMTDCRWDNPTPQIWQKEVWEASDKVYKPKKPDQKTARIDPKGTSLLCAKRLWPLENFLATKRSSVPHDGIIDALLIAEWLRRKYN